jgi:hypothetical protein
VYPDPGSDGILVGSTKYFDTKMLYDPIEKDLDLLATLPQFYENSNENELRKNVRTVEANFVVRFE